MRPLPHREKDRPRRIAGVHADRNSVTSRCRVDLISLKSGGSWRHSPSRVVAGPPMANASVYPARNATLGLSANHPRRS
jgi:hypothetical protein